MGYVKALVAATAVMLGASNSMAATVSLPTSPPYDLLVTASGGAFDGQTASGAVFWNQSLLSGTGYERMSRSGAFGSTVDSTLGLFFDIPGAYTFTEADDDFGPIFTFLDGILQTIDYIVMDSFTPADLASVGVEMFTFDTRRNVTFDGTTVGVTAIVKYLAPVPLPAGLPLLASGICLLLITRRRKQAA